MALPWRMPSEKAFERAIAASRSLRSPAAAALLPTRRRSASVSVFS